MKRIPLIPALMFGAALALAACEAEPVEKLTDAREGLIEAESQLAESQARAQEKIDRAQREAAELRLEAEKKVLESRREAEKATAKAERELQAAKNDLEKARREIAAQKVGHVKEMNEDLRRLEKRLAEIERRAAGDAPESRERLKLFAAHARNRIQQARIRIEEYQNSETVNGSSEREIAALRIDQAEDAVDLAQDYKNLSIPIPSSAEPASATEATSPTTQIQTAPIPDEEKPLG